MWKGKKTRPDPSTFFFSLFSHARFNHAAAQSIEKDHQFDVVLSVRQTLSVEILFKSVAYIFSAILFQFHGLCESSKHLSPTGVTDSAIEHATGHLLWGSMPPCNSHVDKIFPQHVCYDAPSSVCFFFRWPIDMDGPLRNGLGLTSPFPFLIRMFGIGRKRRQWKMPTKAKNWKVRMVQGGTERNWFI